MTAGPGSAPMRGELSVGRVVAPHGLRGGLRVVLYDPGSAALSVGVAVSVRDAGGRLVRRTAVEKIAARPGHKMIRLWLADVTRRDESESLRGCELAVERAQLPLLDPGEFYLADVLDRPILERGRALGRIVGVATNTAQPLLEIESGAPLGPRTRWFLPALPEFLRAVDELGVHVELPPGMGPPQDDESTP